MAGIQDFPVFEDDFFAVGVLPTALTAGMAWKITDTSAAGTPTYAPVSPSATGEVALTMAATSEVENLCLDFGDILPFNINNLLSAEFRVKVSGCTTGTVISWGLSTARNDTVSSIASRANFRMTGATSTTAVTIETDDNVIDSGLIATGATLATVYKRFYIDFSGGKSNVKFLIDGVRLAPNTVFNMSQFSASLQPFFQIQKAANTNVDAVTIDYVRIEQKR